MKLSKGFIIFISLIFVGVLTFLIWQAYQWHVNKMYNQITLLYDVYWAGFSAQCLKTLDDQETEKTRRLLEYTLDSSIRSACELVERGFTLKGSLPNMRRDIELASQYAKNKQLDPEVIKQAEKIFKEGFE
jgi:hypothetical protein